MAGNISTNHGHDSTRPLLSLIFTQYFRICCRDNDTVGATRVPSLGIAIPSSLKMSAHRLFTLSIVTIVTSTTITIVLSNTSSNNP